MQRRWSWAAVLAVCVLSACGGVGDSSSGSGSGITITAPEDLPGRALVTAHAVEADGRISNVELAITTTDVYGKFSLAFQGEQGRAYVVKIAPIVSSASTQVGAAAAAIPPLYDGPALRGALVPGSTGTVHASINLTVFTEMTVAAAARAPGGLTPSNIAQAHSVMMQLLGFDPMKVRVMETSTALTADEQKQAVLLAAVTQMVKDGALSCGGAGSKSYAMRCVVEQMAAAAATTTLSLGAVSGALASAIGIVLADPALRGTVAPELLSNTVSNLHCSGASCVPKTVVLSAALP